MCSQFQFVSSDFFFCVSDIYGPHIKPDDDLSDKVILACHDDDVRIINTRILRIVEGESVTYYSHDTA